MSSDPQSLQKRLGAQCWSNEPCIRRGCTLTPPGEYS